MSGSNVIHFNAVRIRVVGSGNLDLQYQGLNNVLTQDLQPLVMAQTNSREMNRLCNFISQYGKLQGTTDEIDEYFRINSIVLYARPLWTDYPA